MEEAQGLQLRSSSRRPSGALPVVVSRVDPRVDLPPRIGRGASVEQGGREAGRSAALVHCCAHSSRVAAPQCLLPE